MEPRCLIPLVEADHFIVPVSFSTIYPTYWLKDSDLWWKQSLSHFILTPTPITPGYVMQPFVASYVSCSADFLTAYNELQALVLKHGDDTDLITLQSLHEHYLMNCPGPQTVSSHDVGSSLIFYCHDVDFCEIWAKYVNNYWMDCLLKTIRTR